VGHVDDYHGFVPPESVGLPHRKRLRSCCKEG
jgi:hypothetical protein